jgi:radical SAM superfamily enzyme YgiQ (UPF0313 family)
MAAVLKKGIGNKEGIKDLKIKIYDFPANKTGWKTTRKIIYRQRPDILCVGEETVSVHEAFKLIRYTKKINPDCIIIGGGTYFSYMVHDSLTNYPIDFIVRFEGEETLLELVKEIDKQNKRKKHDFSKVKGIAFKHNGRIVQTPMRDLLDMEKLPMPSYDLLNMEVYGKNSTNHNGLVAIEHSRGCKGSCNFCV